MAAALPVVYLPVIAAKPQDDAATESVCDTCHDTHTMGRSGWCQYGQCQHGDRVGSETMMIGDCMVLDTATASNNVLVFVFSSMLAPNKQHFNHTCNGVHYILCFAKNSPLIYLCFHQRDRKDRARERLLDRERR